MASVFTKAVRLVKPRFHSLNRFQKATTRRTSSSSSYTRSLVQAYGSAPLRSSLSKMWVSVFSAPLAYAAFWASNGSDNTMEKVNEDIERLALSMDEMTPENVSLAERVMSRILNLPDKEIERDTMYILAAFSSAAKIIAQADPYSKESERAVEQSYALAKRIQQSSRQSEEIKLDALRCAHKAEYFVYVFRQDMAHMKEVLEKDLKVIQDYDKKNPSKLVLTPTDAPGTESNSAPAVRMSAAESQALWMLAAVQGNLDDPQTKSTLEKSLGIFLGISTKDLEAYPELERAWIERTVSTLQHGFLLEIGQHVETAKEFKRVALALYEQYKRISPQPTSIPEWKELETRLKSAAMASGPQ